MRNLATLISVVVAFLFASASYAYPAHNTATGSYTALCPKGTAWNDGCAGAPADGIVQFPRFFLDSSNGYVTSSNMLTEAQTYPSSIIGRGIARQSGQTYAVLPPHNVAAVDFPVGPSRSQVAAAVSAALAAGFPSAGIVTDSNGIQWKDPKYIANDTTGCTFQPTGTVDQNNNPLGGAQVSCDNTHNLDLEAYDFSLHGCTQLVFASANQTGTIKGKNNKFVNGPGCTTSMVGKGDYSGNNVIAGSPGGAYVAGYVGDEFLGYIAANSTTLCVTNVTQGTVEANNNPSMVLYTPGASTYITAAGGSCIGGGTPYTVAQTSTQDRGTAANPGQFWEANNKFVVTSVVAGSPGIHQMIQYDNNAPAETANQSQIIWGRVITACPGGTCGGTGAYTINAFEVGDAANWVMGASVSGLVSIPLGTAADVDFEQNILDGNDIQYPIEMGCCIITMGNYGTTTFKYNAIFNSQSRPIALNAQHAFVDYNYTEGFETNVADRRDFHGEWYRYSPPQGFTQPGSFWLENINNTILITADTAIIGSAVLWANNSNGAVSANAHLTIKYNTVIVNKNQWLPGSSPYSVAGWALGNYGYYIEPIIDHNFIDGTGSGSCVTYFPGFTTFDNPNPNATLTSNYSLTTGHIQPTWGAACQ